MVESLGKIILEPLAGRWRGVAIGGSVMTWLVLALIVLLTVHPKPGSTWPVDCGPAATSPRPLVCAVAANVNGPVLVLALTVALIVGTAFVSMALAPLLLRTAQAERWGDWPGARRLSKLLHSRSRRKRPRAYPSVVHPAGLRPTRLANRFAALGERVDKTLGLDLTVIWNLLICVVPQETRTQFTDKTQGLHVTCQHLLLCLGGTAGAVALLPGFGYRAMALVLGCLLVTAVWRRLADMVDEYCEMALTTLVLHKDALYEAIGETSPGAQEDLRQRGLELTEKIRKITG
ncbi:hypothetical protein [Streptosporangium sp. LJ11]|uniref:hypothetical protein n=1 Tax=Streptosporangium sp. LJ11 TaxID=3436927 RepID=UPI003F7A9C4A